MDYKFWIILSAQIIGFVVVCITVYAKSYSGEKGKNLATKEDIGEITEIVESIKSSLSIKVEELKSDLLYKNEHLIHLRAAERAAIISYYKATWVLILNLTRPDLTKYEIDEYQIKVDEFGNKVDIGSNKPDEISNSQYVKYTAEAKAALNKIKEELSNLKYLRDVAESELVFYPDSSKLTTIIEKTNSALSALEKALVLSINQLLQIFSEADVKVNKGQSIDDVLVELKEKRSAIFANWRENRYISFNLISRSNIDLKKLLYNRLESLTN